MSIEQRLTRRPAQAAQRPESHSYFVGRREREAGEVYEVTASSVERLRSRRRYEEPGLDWHGDEAARMELSHLLISRVTNHPTSRDLQARFALYVLDRLPDEGFVLDADDLRRWVRLAGNAHDSAPGPPVQRSLLGRVRARFRASRRLNTDA